MTDIVLATGNAGKLREFARLFEPMNLQVVAQSEFSLSSADETGATFVENALLKARHAALHTGLPALADDSGLEVRALNGAPGVRSARYAGEAASDADNVAKLLQALGDHSERQAAFYCVIVALRHAEDPVPLIATGRWSGAITRAPRGEGGFGYDPVFWSAPHDRTAAELTPAEKQACSHRGLAMAELLPKLSGWLDDRSR